MLAEIRLKSNIRAIFDYQEMSLFDFPKEGTIIINDIEYEVINGYNTLDGIILIIIDYKK